MMKEMTRWQCYMCTDATAEELVITTRNKKLLVTKGIATSSKGHRY